MFPALYVHFLIVAKIGMHNGIEKNLAYLAYLAGIWQEFGRNLANKA